MSATADLTMTIGGDAVPAAATFDVINPATGAPFAQAPACTREQLDAAFAAATDAFATWRRDDAARIRALDDCAQALLAATPEIAALLTSEQGKPLSEAEMEVQLTAHWLAYYATLELEREVIQDDAAAFVEVLRRPVGVCAAITPWNFPLALAAWKVGPALRAGNTMVLKPSPYTPLSTLKVAEVLRGVLPPGVLNVVTGGNELGAWMTAHPAVRKISFTGSIATGKRVAEAAAPDLKRLTLELGGNDAAIVLDDADPAAVAQGIFWAGFYNAGQVCCAVKRVYVPDGMYEDVVDALAAQADAVAVGDGADAGTMLGPINNRPQYERVRGLVADAIGGGARVAAGGGPAPDAGDGYFFRPTILADVDESAAIVAEEQFGPALPVLRYRDVDDAIARANGTMYGLSGSVWSPDEDRAAAVAERLDCGTAWVNAHLANAPHQPFGGYKWSGVGVENGPWGLHAYTELQVVHRARATAGAEA